jgi:hypothetical protein
MTQLWWQNAGTCLMCGRPLIRVSAGDPADMAYVRAVLYPGVGASGAGYSLCCWSLSRSLLRFR